MADLTKQTKWTGKDTFAIRNSLKDLGGKWDEASKSWTLPGLSRRELVPAQRLMLKHDVTVENC